MRVENHRCDVCDFEEAVDPTNPKHYQQGPIDAIVAIQSALDPDEMRGYLKGQVFKYLWREGHKGGLEDILKAQWYLNHLVELLDKED